MGSSHSTFCLNLRILLKPQKPKSEKTGKSKTIFKVAEGDILTTYATCAIINLLSFKIKFAIFC